MIVHPPPHTKHACTHTRFELVSSWIVMSHQPDSHLRTIKMWVHSKSKAEWFLVHCTKYWFIMNSPLKTSAWVLWACLVVIRTQWHWAVRMSYLFIEQFSILNRVCCKLTSQFLCRILSSTASVSWWLEFIALYQNWCALSIGHL